MDDSLDMLLRRLDLGRSDLLELVVALGPSPLDRVLALPTEDRPPRDRAPAAFAYEDLGLLGRGGQGEVRRLRDPRLRRTVAAKLLLPEWVGRPDVRRRFLEEAQITAQLQHPGVVAAHGLERWPDGRDALVMAEIRGTTFRDAVAALHQASTGDQWVEPPGGRSFRALVSAFQAACSAVGYAHGRGVVHCDLKPENLMLGEHGEVRVVDWGLAVLRPAGKVDAVGTDWAEAPRTTSRIEGTPQYMAPEQARGDAAAIDVRTDVHALGAVLYFLLSGRPPFDGPDVASVLHRVRTMEPEPPGRLAAPSWETLTAGFLDDAEQPTRPPVGPPLPPELAAACLRALAKDPAQRHPDASALGADVAAWLDGSRRQQQALDVVTRADALLPEIESARARARGLREAAERAQAAVPQWASHEQKEGAWALRDEADRLDRRAEVLRQRRVQLLHGALAQHAELPVAHAALASEYRAQHEVAERHGAPNEALRSEALLRTHVAALPRDHADRPGHEQYLDGLVDVWVRVDARDARGRLGRLVDRLGRRVAEPIGEYADPLRFAVPPGAYLLEATAPGRAGVRVPFVAERASSALELVVRLPPEGSVFPFECFVPAGWAAVGGDPDASHAWPARLEWVGDLCVARDAVTMAEYGDFLQHLYTVDPNEAWERVPTTSQGRVMWRAGRDGAPHLPRTDPSADWPVCCIRHEDAVAYTAWLGAQVPGARLLTEIEWEKTARGLDRRIFPWGNGFDPSFCKMAHSRPPDQARQPEAVGTFAIDTSPYGVRDLGGSMATWCDGQFEGSAMLRPVRGGAWSFFAPNLRSARRVGVHGATRSWAYGVRWCRSLP